MSDLGIFIDESGDVGTNSKFYLVTLVFHNQDNSIKDQLIKLEYELSQINCSAEKAIHAGPIIRKEDDYKNLSLDIRRKIFFKLFSFMRLSNTTYKTFMVDKKEYSDKFALKGKLANEIGVFLRDNLEFFQSFSKVIVYYDNGQALVTDLINTVLCTYLSQVDVRKISPSDYRLSQVADMVCTLELMRIKINSSEGLSHSEVIFFESKRRLSKVFLKTLDKITFD